MTPTTLQGLSMPLVLPLLKATIILVAALGITFVMQRATAGTRHLVWLVTLGALLLLPALDAWGPVHLAILPADGWTPASMAVTPYAPVSSAAPMSSAVQPHSVIGDAPAAATPPAQSIAVRRAGAMPARPSTGALLLALWAAVMTAIGLSLAYAALAVRRIVRHAQPLTEREWLDPVYEVSDRLGLDEVPRVLRSDDAKMPFACGLMTPTIVLPGDCESWSADRRRAVLLHELAHIRRHDMIGHTLGRLVCAVYWFHPLVWTAAKRLRAESERACDDLALACGTRAADYAEHLLDIVTSVRGDATPAVALAMARRKEFEGRMLAILDRDLPHSTPSRRQSLALTSGLALIAVIVGAAAPAPRGTPAPARPLASHDPAQHMSWTRRVDGPVGRTETTRAAMRTRSETLSAMTVVTTPPRDGRAGAESKDVVATATSSGAAGASASLGDVESAATAAVGGVVSGAVDAVQTKVVPALLQSLFNDHATHKGVRNDDRPALLAKVLQSDTSASLRRVAAWGLHEYADQSVAAEALANALRHDSSAQVREMAAWSLAESGDVAVAMEALSAAVRTDASEQVRATAAWALGQDERSDRGSVDALAAALSDASRGVRYRAAWAIGRVEPREAPAGLVALIRDKDPQLRTVAAWSLFRIRDVSSVPALETAVKSETDKEVQMAEIRALAAMGERSVDALRGLLESSDPRVKSIAVHALAGGRAVGPWPWPWPDPRPYP